MATATSHQYQFSEQREPRRMLYIPDTLLDWPWPRVLNPHYEEVREESLEWVCGFSVFAHQPRMKKLLAKCNCALLASLVLPHSSKEHLRLCSDFMYFLGVQDELTDSKPAPFARAVADIVRDVLHNPYKPRPEGEIFIGQILKDFWERALKLASPGSRERFTTALIESGESIVTEARERDKHITRTVEEYLAFRRSSIAARPVAAVAEMCLNIPDEVFYHPRLRELENICTDLLAIDNDMVSYHKEHAAGDVHCNLLTIAMRQFHFNLEQAMEWASEYHRSLQIKFIRLSKEVPSFGLEADKELSKYIFYLGTAVRGNMCWMFESERYFGDKGLEVQRTRRVPLRTVPQLTSAPTPSRNPAVVHL